ncbi:MAG: PspC domain-containing protein [Cryomorphaceae bacterium]|jgi:phage shock protein PspC (stress-responsive transcriptional regulator)|nr:PspC domain-containing protein [Cryomorphaceae bacterium]MBT3503509.1 PspC domain-containing protein [Cryomorphaceae bacterium]MBT3688591.1 PspC domain-containing protein [Cryomorphaceae bacterium]MBT4221907.1 PspC domain-containing protein [Cryomorphaceae bacterium]MBT4834790.1 PspC domain-containing protein [Cryomorphaceae bacterium]
MKKTLNINIGSRVFNIDEDAYDLLSKYLESIKTYFKKIEIDEDIFEDIENRISEKFNSKSESRQSLNLNDVDSIIEQMGTLDDFKEAYDDFEINEPKKQSQESSKKENKKRIYRNSSDKVIAGVASGLANYFGLDPIIFRLIFIASLFTGFGFIAYLIFWIGIPENESGRINENKRLYRDGDNKILGGVAFGLANYFGVDPAIIRILFIVSLFIGGFGLLAYLILWISIPEAKTVGEKMNMKGYTLTLENIEKFIKEKLPQNDGKENIFVKIILLPFRVIGPIFLGIIAIIIPILRILISFILLVFSIVVIVFLVVFTLGALKLINYQNFIIGSIDGFYISGIDLSAIIGELPVYFQLSILLFLVVALLFIIMIILKVLFNIKNNISSRLIGLFFIGAILFIFNIIVLEDTIDKWERSGQIDEWIDEGKLKIENRRSYRY